MPLSVATVAVDVNVGALKENGILLSQSAQNIVEARFLRNIAGSDYLLGNWFKIKFCKIWLYFYMTVFPYITSVNQRTEYCFEVCFKTMEDLR